MSTVFLLSHYLHQSYKREAPVNASSSMMREHQNFFVLKLRNHYLSMHLINHMLSQSYLQEYTVPCIKQIYVNTISKCTLFRSKNVDKILFSLQAVVIGERQKRIFALFGKNCSPICLDGYQKQNWN